MTSFNLLVLLGPTASGKTNLGVKLANHLNAEIISADSRQVYRGLDIGSGKDLHEYGNTPYHLIDVVDPGFEFNVFEFQKRFSQAFDSIRNRQKLPLLVGGTGLYLDSVLSQYRFMEVPQNTALRKQLADESMVALTARLESLTPHLHNTTDLLDRERLVRAIEIAQAERDQQHHTLELPEITPFILGIKWDRATLKERIRQRLHERLQQGMIEEVEQLHANGVSWETLHFYGLEYRFVAAYLQQQLNRNDMVQKLNSAICTFAKQQEKWFRRMERKGIIIHWLDATQDLYEQSTAALSSSH